MKKDRCAICSSYNPIRNYCNRHLRGIEHILSCSADGDPTKIKKETGEVFSKNEVGEQLTLKPAYSDKEEAMIVCNDIIIFYKFQIIILPLFDC